MRLIDGDALIAWIKESQHMTSKMRNIICKVETIPSADRPQGEWIEHTDDDEDGDWSEFECSCCGVHLWSMATRLNGEYLFCPKCGARMKGADDEV